MAGVKHWEKINEEHGITTMKFSNYRWFFDYIQLHLMDYKTYMYRGQKNSTWLLESSLDRLLKSKGKLRTTKNTDQHFENFKYATRGRLPNTSLNISDESDWWALGQHYGLATPLLDWSDWNSQYPYSA